MKQKKILCVFGTRPEAIKMAPVVQALQKHPRAFACRVVVTAQHRDMLDQVLRFFDIRPDVDLNLMRAGQSPADLAARVLSRLKPVFDQERPALVLVHGDTTTALAAALAAHYQRIPVGHVEAGLRSRDFANPFPEEMNRRGVDAVANFHWAPTREAAANLRAENIDPRWTFVTGNTVIDALREGLRRARRKPPSRALSALLPKKGSRLLLMTVHRRENFGRPLERIFQAVKTAVVRHPELQVIYPVHPNPNVRGPARRLLGRVPRLRLVPPMSYEDLLRVMEASYAVMTDSGGLQEEAPALGKPVLVFRDVTERPEAVRAGTVQVVGTQVAPIQNWIGRLLGDPGLYNRMARAVNPYGDGRAAARIVGTLKVWAGFQTKFPAAYRN